MRIAFAGASGTGKSTLAEAVAERYGLPMNPVGSRSVAREMGFENPYDVDAAGRRAEFQNRLMASKIEWEVAHGETGFVTDRTTFDNLAYLAMHDYDALTADMISVATLHALTAYDRVFVCPVASFQKLGDDPVRIKSRGYHLAYEAMLLGFMPWNSRWAGIARNLAAGDRQSRVFGELDCLREAIARDPTRLVVR